MLFPTCPRRNRYRYRYRKSLRHCRRVERSRYLRRRICWCPRSTQQCHADQARETRHHVAAMRRKPPGRIRDSRCLDGSRRQARPLLPSCLFLCSALCSGRLSRLSSQGPALSWRASGDSREPGGRAGGSEARGVGGPRTGPRTPPSSFVHLSASARRVVAGRCSPHPAGGGYKYLRCRLYPVPAASCV